MAKALPPPEQLAPQPGTNETKLSIEDEIALTTVRLTSRNGQGEPLRYGTAFFVKLCLQGTTFLPVLITANHVLKDAATLEFFVTESDGQHRPLFGRKFLMKIELEVARMAVHPDPQVDLVGIVVGPQIHEAIRRGQIPNLITIDRPFFVTDPLASQLSPLEDIVTVGYPQGLMDEVNNLPILRKGTTATDPRRDFGDRPAFLIDAACYEGTSGSPVFLYNSGLYETRQGPQLGKRALLVGVLQEVAPMNLGLVIKASKVLDFENAFCPPSGP